MTCRLRPFTFLPASYSRSPRFRGLRAPAVYDRRAGLGVSPVGSADFGAEGVVDALRRSVGLPRSEVGIDGLPAGAAVWSFMPVEYHPVQHLSNTLLHIILLLPIARSAALFVRGTSPRRRRHNGARHFPLRSTRIRRRVASPFRTARAIRESSKSPSKGRSVSSRHILALTQSRPSILSRRLHTRFFTWAMQI